MPHREEILASARQLQKLIKRRVKYARSKTPAQRKPPAALVRMARSLQQTYIDWANRKIADGKEELKRYGKGLSFLWCRKCRVIRYHENFCGKCGMKTERYVEMARAGK